MTAHWRFPAALMVGAFPLTGWACEPIIPLTQLLSGATLAGPWLLTRSLPLLGLAVAIKCGAFVILERRLPLAQAIAFMVLANILSVIPGLLTAVLSGALTLLAVPVVLGFGVLAQRRVSRLRPQGAEKGLAGKGIAFAFAAAYVASVVMFQLGAYAVDARQPVTYWLVKVVFTMVAATLGMGISAVMEEWTIAHLARAAHGEMSFYTSVIRANYITLGVVLLVAAAQMVPKRLGAPHFIVSWIQSLAGLLGLA